MSECLENLLAMLDSSGPQLHVLLTRLTLREDVAEELMQELFLKLSRSDGFRRAHDPVAYACRAATHLAFDWHRAQKRTPQRESILTELPTNTPSPLGKLIQQEELTQVLEALGELSEVSRDIFVMRYVLQNSFEQIAQELDKTSHQVRGLCHKAVTRFRTLLNAKSSSLPRKDVLDADS